MSVDILYIDRHFLTVLKPQGIPSQPDQTGDTDMTLLVRDALRGMNENDDLYIVHRLDRATGGIMIFARDGKSAGELSETIANKASTEKEYLAVTSNVPQEPSGSFTDLIYRDSRQSKAFIVDSTRKGAKEARLDYEVKAVRDLGGKCFSLLRVRLLTGRFHQIRVQLASRKMPIYGDGKYGSREKSEHFALWAYRLTFEYRGKRYEFEKLPDMSQSPWNLFK